MKAIQATTLEAVLAREKDALIEQCEKDWESGRVQLSAAASARLARVLLLEGILNGSITGARKREAGAGSAPS